MSTHTDHVFDSKEKARQEMHRWQKGEKDGVRHQIWGKTTQDTSDPGHKQKAKTQYVWPTDDGKWFIRVEN